MIWIKFLLLLEIFVKSQATTDVVGNVVQSIFGNNGSGGKPSYRPPGQGKPSYKAPTQNKPSYKPQGGGGGGRKPSYKPQSGGGGGKPSYKPPGRGKPSNGGVRGGVIQSLRNLKSQKTSLIQNLLPFGGGGRKPSGGGKPSYKPSGQNKPSYRPQNGGGRPSYKSPSQGGGARKPSYQNNLQAPSGGQASSPQSYQNNGSGNISDQEMKELLVSIHDMMKQIVATQQANAIIASSIPSPSSGSSAPDSYGNPLASPISGSAPSNYGGPVTSGGSVSASSGYSGPSSSSVPSSGASNTYSSPSASQSRPPASAPTDYVSPSANNNNNNNNSPSASPSSAPDSYGNPQSSVITGSSSSSVDDPLILSTYQQLNSILRTYRAIQERELAIEKKPVKFPQKPSFNDILVLLERRALEKRRDKRQQTAGIQSRSFTEIQSDEAESEETRDIQIESFFRK